MTDWETVVEQLIQRLDKKHVHGEIKIQRNGSELRVNIFADTLNEVFLSIAQVEAQYSKSASTSFAAKREILRAEEAAAAAKVPQQPTPSSQGWPFKEPAPSKANGIVNLPVCKQCGSNENLEKVQFTNQETGQLLTRFKCQTCKVWVGKAF